MTFSVIGRCAHRLLGLGITNLFAGGLRACEGVATNVGICKTQFFPSRTNDPIASS